MPQSEHDKQIDYIEFTSTDIGKTKRFYSSVFGWKFEDYGPDYTSFMDGRIAGGFAKGQPTHGAGALVVLYAAQLEAMEKKSARPAAKS